MKQLIITLNDNGDIEIKVENLTIPEISAIMDKIDNLSDNEHSNINANITIKN